MLADFNTKPTGGASLLSVLYRLIGVRFYPQPGTKHHRLLALEKYVFDPNVKSTLVVTPPSRLNAPS